ncbi:hypothetical protein C0J52_20637 [Blattella germanica]|nr:hypothetical protein C0J52_20637 [Blattella germanica]
MDLSNRAMSLTQPAFLIASLFLLDWEIDQRALAPALATNTSSLSSGDRSSNGVTRTSLLTSNKST